MMRLSGLSFFLALALHLSAQIPKYTRAEQNLIAHLKAMRAVNLDSSILLSKQLKQSGLAQNKPYLIGLSHRLLADAFGNFNRMDSSLFHFEMAEQLLSKAKDTLGLADCCNNYSGVLKDYGNANKAIEKGYKALNLYESLFKTYPNDSLYYFLRAYALNQIAIIFMSNEQEKKAIPLLKLSAKIHLLGKNEMNAYRNYLNLASTYEAIDELDSALYYYQIAIPFFEATDDIEALIVSFNNVGSLYDKKNQAQMSYDYYRKALVLAEKHEVKRQIVQSLTNLSNIDFKMRAYDLCILKLERAASIAEAISAQDFLKIIYNKLKNTYAFKNDFVRFNLYDNKSDSLSTILYEQQSAKALIEAEKKFETEKKDLVIKQQKSDIELSVIKNRQKTYLLYGSACVLALVSFLGFLAFRNYLKIRKANRIIKVQNGRLEESNTEIRQQKHELEQKNREIMESILYSKYLQTAILPRQEAVERISKVSFIKYQPKDIVSGDYYWTHNTPNGLSIWATMDCTGHGVPGAMMSMLGISLLNEIVIEKHIYKPSEILNRMRERIIFSLNQNSNLELKDGMDGSICVWDKRTNILSYASANSAIWIYRNGEFIELNYNKMPIGKHLVMDPFENHAFQLADGDWVTTMSDGLVDQFGGPENKKLKYKRVREFLSEKFETAQYDDISHNLQTFYEEWKGLNEQTDDVTVFGIKI